jgi:TolB-like protein/tetratricopeptide (TPR) repeat protein
MAHEQKTRRRLEIAHVLFLDIVGYSKLLIDEQSEALQELNQIVRNTEAARQAEACGRLIILPTGDGMALVFTGSVEDPVECALQVSQAFRGQPNLPVRMGIHSGPVHHVHDINGRQNIAGDGINIAQRVMDCGDAGHILISKRVAGDLAQHRHWRPYLHELGQCEVKHGERIGLVNFYGETIGNRVIPQKIRSAASRDTAAKRKPMIVGLIVAGAVLLLLVLFAIAHHRALPAPAADKRIAVLPFKPLLPENRDPVLELGMADTLITKLSNARAVVVSSLNSVRKFTALDQDARAAGRELHVDSVLEGNVQKVGDRIRASARLINVADGTALWSGAFDQRFTDVFAVQDAISQKVADALALRLNGQQKGRLTRRYTEDIEAYQLYLAGRYHHGKLIPSEIRTAIECFEKAIARDPNYALAYFGLAECYRSLAITSDVPAKESLPQAKEAALKAIALDPDLAEAHGSLSFTLIWYDWNWQDALKEAERAVALDPNSGFCHFAHAHVLSDLARHDEALAEARRASDLEPVYLLIRSLEGMFLYHARRTNEAQEVLEKALELDASFWVTHLTLGKVYAAQGRYADAIAEFSQARELSHGNSEAIGSIAYAAGLAGDTARAQNVLGELKSLSAQRYIPPVPLALAYESCGARDESIAALERACDEHDVRLTLLKVDPRWDSLRSDPRFTAMLKRIGLE